jgi:N-acetyl-anhydromuramyl-L-alanine amidase AmpD
MTTTRRTIRSQVTNLKRLWRPIGYVLQTDDRVMGSRLVLCAAVVAALAVVGPSAGTAQRKPPDVTWVPAPPTNFEPAARTVGDIRLIVIHVTDGSFAGAVSWLTNPQSHVSAHYAVSRDGEIAQMVARKDIAWHAGNHVVNAESIGIEHEGVTDDISGFTDAEYRASARLVAWLARLYDIPIDRQHIIGHSEVPDPTDPTQGGGIDHHTDPGTYWNWTHYMHLVHRFAKDALPVLRVSGANVKPGKIVAGIVSFAARTTHARRVDFVLDGRVILRDVHPPFVLRWNTNRLRNGRHVLVLRAYGSHGRVVVWRAPFVVENHPLTLVVNGIATNTMVDGPVRIRAAVGNGRARSVRLLVDRRLLARRSHPPFIFRWNGAKAKEGFHVLQVRARSIDGRTAQRSISVLVAHPKPQVVYESLTDGQVVQGPVVWTVTVKGSVRRLEWLIDGKLRWTSTELPFVFGGKGGTWDTAAETRGPHTLTVRMVTRDGSSAETTISVTVAAP